MVDPPLGTVAEIDDDRSGRPERWTVEASRSAVVDDDELIGLIGVDAPGSGLSHGRLRHVGPPP